MFILKQLRRKKNISQTSLAEAIGVSLRTIQLYEKKDANIPIKNLTKIAQYFDISIAELYLHEVNESKGVYGQKNIITKKGYHAKPIGVGKYLINVPLVSAEDQKNFTEGWGDKNFVESLTKIGFVITDVEDRNYLAFEISNDAMDNESILGIPNRAIVLAKTISPGELRELVDDSRHPICVVIHDRGLLCKQIIAYDPIAKAITCHSLNPSPEYTDFELALKRVRTLFLVVKKQVN